MSQWQKGKPAAPFLLYGFYMIYIIVQNIHPYESADKQ
jgi:hypothetical protein